MKPFKLEAVLDHKKRAEHMAQKELLASMEAREGIAGMKALEESEIERLCHELGDAKTNEVLVSDLILYELCIRGKREQVRALEQKLRESDAGIRRKERQLVQARQEKRALEIVRDNRERQEAEKQKHLENLFLDELAIFGHGGVK